MGPDVLKLVLTIWLLPKLVMSKAIRLDEEYQSQEERPCDSYELNGLLHIDCSYRCLSELPEGLDSNAQSIDLSNNAFLEFPAALQNFSQLQTLDLSANRLSRPLPAYIENWTNFLTLNLSNNNYETWTTNGRRYSVKKLDLSKNKMSKIDESALMAMRNLSFLDLSENRIYNVPWKVIADLTNLETLILSRNYISELPNIQSSSIKFLRMCSCQITNLEADSISRMTSLLAIDLSMNQIERIPDNFASNNLQELDLSYNEIGTLTDYTFQLLPNLAVLNLRGNEFREVWSTSHFASNPFLREVHVRGNRWSCEGFSVNLLLTYEYLTPRISDQAALICYTPSNVTQMSWQQAYIQTWHSGDAAESYTVMAVMIGIIIGILITSFVCRALMAINKSEDTPLQRGETTVLNINGGVPQQRAESVVMRVPLREELPPSYDEALLMPRLNSSFHSLPDFVDEEIDNSRRYRRSRSIGDLTEPRTRATDRRSVRRTVQIHIS